MGSARNRPRLPGEDLLTREREKQDELRKQFVHDAVAQGALADPSGRQKAGIAFQSCALHGPLFRLGPSSRREGRDLRQGCPMGQGQCRGRASSVSRHKATPPPPCWGNEHLRPKGELEQPTRASTPGAFPEEKRSELSFRAHKYPHGKNSVLGREKSNVSRQGTFRKHRTFGKPSGIQQTHEACWKAGPKERRREK